ncbi:Na(+)/H(+) exchanger beta-like isoform X2 [Amphiura filiformis]|uniref:Na(+)/H(+) exchanger beta-like isoform X2 n=1 Tax=Amphiura filiformis TaxID=82378 RepID=UPI003B228735
MYPACFRSKKMFGITIRVFFFNVILLTVVSVVASQATTGSPDYSTETTDENHTEHHEDEFHHLPEECEENITHFEVVSFEWHEVMTPFGIAIWVLIASIAKLGFHYTILPHYLPESCLLVIIGFIIGVVVAYAEGVPDSLKGGLSSDLFFLFLLPPIMLEAGYFMPARAFFSNIGTILLYAVIGTLFNTLTIGFSLYGISVGFDVGISLLECLTFSSLISAVDPVAVLAVFEEIHVNEVLHILVFGESLLNDAVTVVLYRMFESFNAIGENNLTGTDIILGVVSFFVVSIGGIIIGLIYGVITAFCTKYTIRVRVIEPIFVFVMSYLSYLTAEMFRLSPILSIVACAMFMKPYVEANISQKSHTTIKYFMKMLSSISETVIFIFLGATAVSDKTLHEWNSPFVFFCLIFCFVYRFIGVIWQTALVNQFRLVRIGFKDQFVMGYGGIRGAIAFSLVTILCPNRIMGLPILFTTTIMVVMFTIFIQGMTIKPIVEKLKVQKADEEQPSMNQQIFSRLSDHLLAGVEDILGHYGSHHYKDKWELFEKKTIRRWLVRDHGKEKKSGIVAAFTKIETKEAVEYVRVHGALPSSASLGNMLKTSPSGNMLYMGDSMGMSMPHIEDDDSFVEPGSKSKNLLSVPLFAGHAPDTKHGIDIPQILLNDSEPVDEGMAPVDLQKEATPGLTPKDRQESIGRHMDLLAKSLYRPRKRHDNRQSRHFLLDDEVEEPKKLMHRSMTIQVRHRMSKKPRHTHGNQKQRYKPKQPASTIEDETNANGPAVIDTIHENDDEGITFQAKHDEPDAVEPPPPTAAETSLPWKRDSAIELSERARDFTSDPEGDNVAEVSKDDDEKPKESDSNM